MPELSLTVNGQDHALDVPVGRTLADALRLDLGLTGTKIACGEGHCGACTVQLDGVPVLSCITLAHTVDGREVTTIEGLREHALVDAFVEADATQCGFCTPGQIVSASALLTANPHPSHDEIRHAMAGNLCRCGTYPKIERAIHAVAANGERD
jgi:aerobic-type carbon monoxide dehydrogenase small subunit (CoxS/CutS family)